MQRYIAHVRKDSATDKWIEHTLEGHLQEVGRRSGEAAQNFSSHDWGYLAGLWHDLGKYKADFQSYIRSATGYRIDAHLENVPGKVDHSTAGAIHAVQKQKGIGRVLAYLIAGHHSGLPDWFKDKAEGWGLEERLNETRHLEETRKADIPKEILEAALPASKPPQDPEQIHLWIRMLFSSLVDADFLDTEAFMDPEKAEKRGPTSTLKELHVLFRSKTDERDAELKAKGNFELLVNKIRREVLADCRKAADLEPGFFSLTVPTGGGKTLSSLAFALEHALRYGKRRVIMAIPFTSIIEQAAQIFSEVLGSENVLEHHSNVDLDRETVGGRLAAENWDAPVVVTTNVQFFESLFASRTSRCRKLHNIVDSVIILDEAQMLPSEFLAPTLSVLKGLVKHFGCTVVLCTATQPALLGEIGSQKARFQGLDCDSVREIVTSPAELAVSLKRVQLRFQGPEKIDWPSLAGELSGHRQVLCIVNRRQDCRELWEAVRQVSAETPVHLSALMCGEHRSKVIRRIKEDLSQDRPLCVISTQLVEAGVDIDFPVVFRAMAGLDSIAQAAGRCNREGKLKERLGEVVIFNPPKPSPSGLLLKMEQAGSEVIRTWPDRSGLLSPDAFRKYFQCFYRAVNDFGRKDFKSYGFEDAGEGECRFQFRSAAQWYRLIDEQGYRSVVVWYEWQSDSDRYSSRKILEELRYAGPSRERMRRLQRCLVNVPERVWQKLRDQGSIAELKGPEGAMGLWAQCVDNLYDETFGLRLDGPEDFIC